MPYPTSWTLPFDVSAPSAARELLTAHCSADGSRLAVNALCDGLLLVTEVVTNAVRHGADPIRLLLTEQNGRLRVEVVDHGTALPVQQQPGDLWSDAGRGLALVDILSTRWGVNRVAVTGKSVWFELPAPVPDTVRPA